MGKTITQISNEIIAKILTGGRRTTAENTRSVLNDINESKLSLKDGGLVVEVLTGYNAELTPTDSKHFATKKYVDDNAGSSFVKITDEDIISLIVNSENWTDSYGNSPCLVGGRYTGPEIPDIPAGAYYIDPPTGGPDPEVKHKYEFWPFGLETETQPLRIVYYT